MRCPGMNTRDVNVLGGIDGSALHKLAVIRVLQEPLGVPAQLLPPKQISTKGNFPTVFYFFRFCTVCTICIAALHCALVVTGFNECETPISVLLSGCYDRR